MTLRVASASEPSFVHPEWESDTWNDGSTGVTDERGHVDGALVGQLLLEDAARELTAQLDRLQSLAELHRWQTSHTLTVAALLALLPDCPAKRRLEKRPRVAAKRISARLARAARGKRKKGVAEHALA